MRILCSQIYLAESLQAWVIGIDLDLPTFWPCPPAPLRFESKVLAVSVCLIELPSIVGAVPRPLDPSWLVLVEAELLTRHAEVSFPQCILALLPPSHRSRRDLHDHRVTRLSIHAVSQLCRHPSYHARNLIYFLVLSSKLLRIEHCGVIRIEPFRWQANSLFSTL